MGKQKRHRKSATERRSDWQSEIDDELKQEILFAESERGAVLVGTAFIEEGLEHVLRAAFSSLCETIDEEYLNNLMLTSSRNPNPPLGSFAVRTKIAYAIGLIDQKFRQGLDELRLLRNSLAHRSRDGPRPQLTHENVNALIALVVSGPAKAGAGVYELGKVEAPDGTDLHDIDPVRYKFLFLVWIILDRLTKIEQHLISPSNQSHSSPDAIDSP
jgi:hypothetical protein